VEIVIELGGTVPQTRNLIHHPRKGASEMDWQKTIVHRLQKCPRFEAKARVICSASPHVGLCNLPQLWSAHRNMPRNYPAPSRLEDGVLTKIWKSLRRN